MKVYSTPILQSQSGETGEILSVGSTDLPSFVPGQYFRAFVPGADPILPIALYLYNSLGTVLSLCGKIPSRWKPGDTLLLQGPFGRGFQQGLKAKRLTLYAHDKLLETRLISLALVALQNKADVVWVSDEVTIPLPPQVEILKASDLHSAITWSDASAIAVQLDSVGILPEFLPSVPAERGKVEVFIDAPQICGNALCGVCAIETARGWKIACKDGPVFPLRELLGD